MIGLSDDITVAPPQFVDSDWPDAGAADCCAATPGITTNLTTRTNAISENTARPTKNGILHRFGMSSGPGSGGLAMLSKNR